MHVECDSRDVLLGSMSNEDLVMLSRSEGMRQQCEAELVSRNLGLVEYVIRTCNIQDWMFDDLRQVGMVALVRACRKWDPVTAGGAPWSRYAAYGIRRAVWSEANRLLRWQHAPLSDIAVDQDRSAEYRLEAELLLLLADEREREIVWRHVSGETQKDIGDDIGVCRERVRQLFNRGIRQIRSRKNGG